MDSIYYQFTNLHRPPKMHPNQCIDQLYRNAYDCHFPMKFYRLSSVHSFHSFYLILSKSIFVSSESTWGLNKWHSDIDSNLQLLLSVISILFPLSTISLLRRIDSEWNEWNRTDSRFIILNSIIFLLHIVWIVLWKSERRCLHIEHVVVWGVKKRCGVPSGWLSTCVLFFPFKYFTVWMSHIHDVIHITLDQSECRVNTAYVLHYEFGNRHSA